MFARSSGRKACRQCRVCPLSGLSHKQTPACACRPQAFICSPHRVCAHVSVYQCVCSLMLCVHAHAYFIVCPYQHVYTPVSICVHVCVCVAVCIWAVFKLSALFRSVCGFVCVQTDAAWWSECQYCSSLPITIRFFLLSACSWPLSYWCVQPPLCVCVFMKRLFNIYRDLHGNPEEREYQKNQT